MPNSTRKFIIVPFSLIRDYGPKYCALKVGGIVPGRLSKLIIMSFLFLPNRGFSPKYYLFDSVLLSRIVSINTEQDFFFFFINWDFGPGCRSKFENKKNLQDCTSIHHVIISEI